MIVLAGILKMLLQQRSCSHSAVTADQNFSHTRHSVARLSPLVDCSCSRSGIVIPLTLHINQQSGRIFAQLEDYFESQFQARMMLTSPNVLALQWSLGFVHLSQDLINKSSCCGSQLCYFTLTQNAHLSLPGSRTSHGQTGCSGTGGSALLG